MIKFSTHQAIEDAYSKREQGARMHLGCSEIGKQCDRALWYSFRHVKDVKFSGRMLRLFETGHLEEHRFVENLKDIGANVYDVNPDTGEQFKFSIFGGHFSGSCDAIASNIPEDRRALMICEFKTHSSKSFKALLKEGVEVHKPEHFVQMQCYMGFSTFKKGLYLAVNKDTDELYSEVIEYDEDVFNWAKDRAEKIIFGNIPQRISEDRLSDDCKYCDYKEVCFGDIFPKKNCRTCKFSSASSRGVFECSKHERDLFNNETELGCLNHLFKPELINATLIDETEKLISYAAKNGATFSNCSQEVVLSSAAFKAFGAPVFYSSELSQAPMSAVTNVIVAKTKELFDCKFNFEDIKK